MRRCTCSVRALEIFVNDLAGLSIQRPRPRFAQLPHRTFSSRTSYRQLETSQITAERFQNSFVPNGSIQGDINEQTKQTTEDEDAPIRSLSELDEAWNSDAVETTTQSGEGGSKHDDFRSAEDVATQEESVEMKKMARKMRGLERKRKRKAEGNWAPVKRDNEARKAVEGAEESEEVKEVSESAVVAEVLKAPEPRRQRSRGGVKPSDHTSTKVGVKEPKSRSKKDTAALKAVAATERRDRTRKAVESKTRDPAMKSTKNAKIVTFSKPKEKEVWQVQKASLERKFGEQGWQPKKRLSPDTLEGIRALHNSDPAQYNTETLAKHFQITPEAIRRILKSKWRPNEDEAEDRRQRWEKRGVKKWTEMAELGVRPPSKWRQLGVKSKDQEQKKLARASRRGERGDPGLGGGDEETAESFAGRIL